MDIETLRWFQQVADGVTLTEVADLEMVSQPAVSRALGRLEAEVGTPLLRRSGRRLTLTAAGAALKRHVDAVVHHLDDGLAAVQQLLDPSTGTLSLAFAPSLGTWLVPELIAGFRVEYPDIEVDLRSTAMPAPGGADQREVADLTLSTSHPPSEEFEWRTLVREPLRLAIPQTHPLRGADAVEMAELAGEGFVCLPSGSLRRAFDELCLGADVSPEVATVVPDLATLRACVASGLGPAVVPALWSSSTVPVSRRLAHVALRDAGAEREVMLIWPSRRRMLPAAHLFREHVLARAGAGDLPSPVEVGSGAARHDVREATS